MILSGRIARFIEAERGAAALLAPESIAAQALAATAFYAGYAALDDVGPLSVDLDLSDSEWALIRPLFLLYVERETALQLESTRGLGADPFGRASSEIAADITQMEADYPRRVFMQPVVTV
jgi:hypothetical protein